MKETLHGDYSGICTNAILLIPVCIPYASRMQSVIKRSVIVDRQTARQKKHTDSLTDIDTDK